MMAAANVDNGQVDRGGKSGNIHRTDLGILVNHAYTLLDAREALSKRYVGAIKANLELLESIGNDRDAAASV